MKFLKSSSKIAALFVAMISMSHSTFTGFIMVKEEFLFYQLKAVSNSVFLTVLKITRMQEIAPFLAPLADPNPAFRASQNGPRSHYSLN